MSIEQITDALEVLSVNFANLTHLVQKFAEREMDGKDDGPGKEYETVPSFKVIIVGDGGVGKTTFVKRHITGDFDQKYIATLGVEVHPIGLNTNYGPVGFNIWDCAGTEKFGGLRDGYYVGAQAAIVMYDVAQPETFKNVDMWIEKIRKMQADIPIIVVGNKVDATGFGALRSNVWGKDMQHYYISAKSMYNYVEPFQCLARVLMKRNDLTID
jgi:GTP-binding nuclear protein Ran